jgi:2-oxoglutarate dehydrogenase complex dehydrogenase (E1) component-like enzyme
MLRSFRKPLVVISPKKLLRFKDASSDIEEFDENQKF